MAGTEAFGAPPWALAQYRTPDGGVALGVLAGGVVRAAPPGWPGTGLELFDRWAAQTPPDFRFAVKMPPWALRALGDFEDRVRRLGERLGPLRLVLPNARDDGLLALLLGSIGEGLRLALDLRHDSWRDADIAPAVAVDDTETDAPFRYLRFREPPYTDEDLARIAAGIAPDPRPVVDTMGAGDACLAAAADAIARRGAPRTPAEGEAMLRTCMAIAAATCDGSAAGTTDSAWSIA